MEQTNYKDYLKEELNKRMNVNSRYSQRAFARDLGLSAGELSEILKGKRNLSLKKALIIADGLGLSSFEIENFVELLATEMTPENKRRKSSSKKQKLSLEADLFNIISEWYCFAILNLSECEGFQWDSAWIAKKLGITSFQAKHAIERMIRVGLITKTKNGLVASDDFVFSPDGVPSHAIKNYHQQVLKMAENALLTQKIEEREISGLGIAMDPKHIPSIKKDIAKFRNELVEKYSKGTKTTVYQLEFALFQLTQGETND